MRVVWERYKNLKFVEEACQTCTGLLQMKAITKLKETIENRLMWGPAETWSNYDFEKLSDEILKETGVNLSVSTLKRFFGKVAYRSKPSVTTLNTLARFVNYEDWRDFESKQESEPIAFKNPEPPKQEQKSPEMPVRMYVFTGVILIFLVASALYFRSRPKYNPEDFSFSSKTVLTSGLPNSVIFDYDASNVEEQDSVFISQSWDIRRRVAVDKNGRHHSSIYYYPGYFKAKLMAGDFILKEHDIQIITDGWLSVLEAPWGERPTYFDLEETRIDGGVSVTEELIEKYGEDLKKEHPSVRFYNQKDISGFMTDNFEFETEVKSDFGGGSNACQQVQVYLQAKDDIMIIPLTQPACVGDLFLAAYGFGTQSTADDLSGFGCDLNDWVKLRVSCKDRHCTFYVNEIKAYEADIQNPASEIVGVQYRFGGTGAVRNARLGSGENGVDFE